MARVMVPYTCRVWVIVDTDLGEVVEVETDLDSTTLDTEAVMLDVTDILDEIRWNKDAADIAENSDDWPAWSHS